jgi:O-antigen/teichoic acid export membrane protein
MLARAVTLNVAGQLGGFSVSFVSSILIARLLGPSDRGLLAIMLTVATVAVALTGAGLASSVQYFASRRETPQPALLGNSLVYGVLLAAVFVPVFFVARGPLGDVLAHGRGGLVWLLAGAIVPLTFLDFTTAGQLCGRLQFELWNVLLVAARLLTLVCVGLLVGIASLGVPGAIVATGAASMLVIGVSCVTLMREGRPRFDTRLLAQEVLYGTRAQVGQLFQFLNYRFDLLILSLFSSLAAVGYYAVAQTLAELVIYLGTAFQISVLPLVSRFEGDERQAATTQAAVRHHGVLALGVIALNALVAPLVLLFGYGDAFRPALVPLLVLLPGMWFLGTGNLISGDLRGRGRPGLTSVLKAAAAAVTVALDFALIPRFGVTGAAAASSIAYTFFGVISLSALARVSGVSVKQLVLPTRADLALYPRAVRALAQRARGVRPAPTTA